MSLLSLEALTVKIGNKTICEDLNFELQRGQRWGMLGGNGIGKTTLLQTLAGLRPVNKGKIIIDGVELGGWKRKQLAQKVGVLFQDSQDAFPVSVMETALTGRHPYLPFWSVESNRDYEIVSKALQEVSMDTMTSRQVNTLSGGERRRLAIATMLVQNPLIWLLDEPTNHLDMHHQISLLDLIINKINAVNGGLLMVLHDVNLLTRFCTHAMLIVNEKNLLCGPVDEIITRENLQQLYHHPIQQISSGEKLFYYPQ